MVNGRVNWSQLTESQLKSLNSKPMNDPFLQKHQDVEGFRQTDRELAQLISEPGLSGDLFGFPRLILDWRNKTL